MSNHISGDSKVVHIGFDDTDSAEGRCTTNLAFKTISKLTSETDSKFIDYPLLVQIKSQYSLENERKWCNMFKDQNGSAKPDNRIHGKNSQNRTRYGQWC